MCEPPRAGVCGGTDFLMSSHELAQERLYRLWRAGWVTKDDVQLWTQSLERLQGEGNCDYLMWLLRTFPPLVESDAASQRAL
jgi:hypothetical protein